MIVISKIYQNKETNLKYKTNITINYYFKNNNKNKNKNKKIYKKFFKKILQKFHK